MITESSMGTDKDDLRTNRWTELALRTAGWVLAAAALVPMIFLPLTRDQGHYAYGGQVILDGGQLYRDVFDGKGPGVYYAYAFALWLFGQTELGVRLFFYLLALLGSRLAAAVGRRVGGNWCSLPCALAYAFAAMQGHTDCAWFTAEGEDLILPLVLTPVVLLGRREHLASAWRMALAGFLLALALLVKVTAVTTIAALGLVTIFCLAVQKRGASAVVKPLLWAMAGMLVPIAAFFMYYGSLGLLGEIHILLVRYNREYGSICLMRDFTDYFRPLTSDRWRALSVLGIAAVAMVKDKDTTAWRLFGAVVLGGWLAAGWQGKDFPYQWTPVIGSLAVAAGITCGRVAQWAWANLTNRVWAAAGVATTTLLLPLFAGPTEVYHLNRLYRQTLGLFRGTWTREEFREHHLTGAATANVTDKVAAYLREHSQAGDTVQVWGYETILNFLSNRRSPTRFVLRFPLSQPGKFRQMWREQFLREIRSHQPLYVVVLRDDVRTYWLLDEVSSDGRLKEFAAFDEYLREHYVQETQIDRFLLLRRTPPTPPGPAAH